VRSSSLCPTRFDSLWFELACAAAGGWWRVTDTAGPELEPLFWSPELEPLFVAAVEGRVAVRRVPTTTALVQGIGFRFRVRF